jgi:hypothetical protein
LIIFSWLASNQTAPVIAVEPISWMPSDVNAVARINVAEIYKSPLAQKEGWIRQAAESFIQQQSLIPPGTNQIFIGAELDLADGLTANRKYSILVPETGMTLEKLSPWLPNGIETIGGKTFAQFGPDAYVADVGDGCWLAMTASRQAISRWIKTNRNANGGQMTRYLRAALNSKENNKSQVLIAVDLQDNFSPQKVAEELKATDWFKAESVIDFNSKVLASVEGVTIGLNIENERTGFAMINFTRDPASLKPVIEKLVDSVMQRIGISTDDFKDWKWSIKGNQIIGTGAVSDGGGRRLISILDPPSVTQAISSSSTPPESTPEEKMAKTSLKYLKSVQVLLDDFRELMKKTNDHHPTYLERYARKIDDLPRLHVDPMILDFGAKVSSSLRYQSQSSRMHKINAATRNIQTYSSAGTSYVGPYGWYSSTPTAGVGIGIKAQESEENKSLQFSEWKQIEDGLAAVRRAMTEKYQIEF